MTEEFIKEAKNFRRQMKWVSIMCWVATLAFITLPFKNPNADYDWVIVPVGAVIFSIIYFSMDSNIKKYEELKKNE